VSWLVRVLTSLQLDWTQVGCRWIVQLPIVPHCLAWCQSTHHTVNSSPVHIHWWPECLVVGLLLGLVSGLFLDDNESACRTDLLSLSLFRNLPVMSWLCNEFTVSVLSIQWSFITVTERTQMSSQVLITVICILRETIITIYVQIGDPTARYRILIGSDHHNLRPWFDMLIHLNLCNYSIVNLHWLSI